MAQQGGGAGAAAGVGAGQAPPAPAFALMPAAAIQGIIDYTSREGNKLYVAATQPLSKEEGYECEPIGLHGFLQKLHERASMNLWNDPIGILHVPEDMAQPMINQRYMITEYGLLTMEQIRAFEVTYLGTQTRAAQDNHMLYRCLIESLSTAGFNKVVLWREDYHVGDNPSALLLLKVIIRESHVDTNATTATIRQRLSTLDTYLPTVGHDISKLNDHVMLLTESLTARGEQTNDTLVNLFKAYMAASDKEFVGYIKRKYEGYIDGTLQELTYERLMLLARNKWQHMVDEDTWNAPSAEEEKIIALRAEMSNFKKSLGNKGHPQKDKPNIPRATGTKSNRKVKPEWFKIAPVGDKKRKPRQWNNKDWWWCAPETGGKCAGNWRIHKPSACEGTAHKFKRPKSPSGAEAAAAMEDGDENSTAKKLKVEEVVSNPNDNGDHEYSDEYDYGK